MVNRLFGRIVGQDGNVWLHLHEKIRMVGQALRPIHAKDLSLFVGVRVKRGPDWYTTHVHVLDMIAGT